MSEKRKDALRTNNSKGPVAVENVTLQELLNIRWGDVLGTLVRLRQRSGTGRANRPVTIPISDDLRKLLDQVKLTRGGL